jgi:hypothetical protein
MQAIILISLIVLLGKFAQNHHERSNDREEGIKNAKPLSNAKVEMANCHLTRLLLQQLRTT